MREALVLGAAYLLGSIPFAWIVVRGVGGGDIRRQGSGNVGASNVMRTSGVGAGLLVLVTDVGKGVAAVALARAAALDEGSVAAAGLLAIVGHIFPVWLRGHGGKGVATAAGVFAWLAPAALGFAVVIFAATLVVWRYVSLGSIVATCAMVSATVFGGYSRPLVIVAIVAGALIVARHSSNIVRLRAGIEPSVWNGSGWRRR